MMLAKVDELKTKIVELRNKYDIVNNIIEYRKRFMDDPSRTVMAGSRIGAVDDKMEGFISILSNPDNTSFAVDDGIGVINTELTTVVSELVNIENKIVSIINAIVKINPSICAALINNAKLPGIKSIIIKAQSNVVFARIFENKLETRLNTEMKTKGIAANTYVEWLYGIYSDIKEDNVSALLSKTNHAFAFNLLKNTVIDSHWEFNNELVPWVNTEQYSDVINDGCLKHYSLDPESKISGLTIVYGIISGIDNTLTELANNLTFTELDNIGVATKIMDSLTRELEDHAGDIPDTKKHIYEYEMVINNIGRMSSLVVGSEVVLYSELCKYVEVSTLLDTCVVDI